ncbi:MAG TPA: hypothetical protein VII01_04030, partial [Solirubrobacteraceae bacterium]
MPDEPAQENTAVEETEVEQPMLAYDSAYDEADWSDESQELPPRPRRRLLAPTPVAMFAVLLIAAGFIGGVLVEKGQGSSTAATSGSASLTSRFAGLRGGSGASTTGLASGSTGASGAGGATVGQVAFIQGSILYVTNTQGNTVKVNTSPGSTVTKTVNSSVKSLHPGETVVVTGTPGAKGSVIAESIRVGTGGAGGSAGSLFGGST